MSKASFIPILDVFKQRTGSLPGDSFDDHMINVLSNTTVGGDPEFAPIALGPGTSEQNRGRVIDLGKYNFPGTKAEPYCTEKEYLYRLPPGAPMVMVSPSTDGRTPLVVQQDNACAELNMPVCKIVYDDSVENPKHNELTKSLLRRSILFNLHADHRVGRWISLSARVFNTTAGALSKYLSTLVKDVLCEPLPADAFLVQEDMLGDPRIMSFGCSPDYNIYTGTTNPSACPYIADQIRFAGGHVSLSFDKEMIDQGWHKFLIRLLDLWYAHVIYEELQLRSDEVLDTPYNAQLVMNRAVEVGILSSDELSRLVQYPFNRDAWPLALHAIRRKFYGTAGSYRITPFGIEYRTPGPAVYSYGTCTQFMLEGIVYALTYTHMFQSAGLSSDDAVSILHEAYPDFDEYIQHIINFPTYEDLALMTIKEKRNSSWVQGHSTETKRTIDIGVMPKSGLNWINHPTSEPAEEIFFDEAE